MSCFRFNAPLELTNMDLLPRLSQRNLALTLAVARFLMLAGEPMATRATYAQLV